MLIHPIPIDITWPNSHKVFGIYRFIPGGMSPLPMRWASPVRERGRWVALLIRAIQHDFPHIFSNFWSSTFFFVVEQLG
jgi:hypothetical protein